MPRFYRMFLFKVRTIVSKRIKDKFDIIRVPRLDFHDCSFCSSQHRNIWKKIQQMPIRYKLPVEIAFFHRWEFSENLLKLNLTWELKFTNFSLG